MATINRTSKDVILLTLGAGMFAYVALRAYVLSFTHDESLSYTIIVSNSFYKDLPNNHVVNTALMAFCNVLFGSSEFSLRIPNVLSFALYFVAFYWIAKPQENIALRALAFVALLLNHYLVDFFSLCRGYGLSMGFLLASLYCLLDQYSPHISERTIIRNFTLSIVFAGLALCSNLVMINYYFICILANVGVNIFHVRTRITLSRFQERFGIAVFIASLVPLVVAARHLLYLSKAGQLFVGEETLVESLDSLIASSLYMIDYPSWLSGALLCACISSVVLGITSIIIKRDLHGRFALITCILVLLIGAIVVQHWAFSARYPSGRTALYFIPVYGLFVYYFALHVLEIHAPSRSLFNAAIVVVCLLALSHFVLCANLKRTREWFYDADTKSAMKIIEERTESMSHNASISNHWLFEPSINYYIISRGMKLNPATRDGVNLNSDFIYRLDDNSDLEHFTVLADYKETNSNLLTKN